MTLSSDVSARPSETMRFPDRLEKWLDGLARPLATLGVLGMLIAAGATVIDVLLRWLLRGGVVALNEITSMAFAVAITACIPAGLAGGVNLKIDIFSRWITGRLAIWLDALGAFSLVFFFAVLTRQIAVYAANLAAQGRTTVILGWPQAPFMYAVVVLLGIGTIVQAVVTINAVRKACSYDKPDTESYPVVTFIAGVLAFLVVALAAYAAFNFSGMSRWALNNPGSTVAIAFVMMWILMLGLMPLATLTGLIGIIGAALFIGWAPALSAFATEATGLLTNSQIATLPLFLMMGSFAAVSGMADDLYRLAHVLFGRYRGGLALATIGSCAGFGALTGSSLATAATIGRVAIPEMRERGYSPALATGVCAAGGTLGPLVPPGSGPIIVFALLTEASIGQLFVASVGPAILAVLLYLLTIVVYVRVARGSAPPIADRIDAAELRAALKRCVAVALLVFGVMGGLYFGIFTDIESAAVGAIGAFLAAFCRGKLNRNSFFDVMVETTATTAMVYGLIIGAQVFSFFVGVSALTESATAYISGLNWSPLALMTLILVIYLILGTVMESFAVMIITVPIVTPMIIGLGYDVIWWGIVMLCVVETGMIHPPFGINVFVLKGMTPDVSLWTIYKGVTPFVVADLVKLVLMVLIPAITLWLPHTMIR
jgi:tripartite ATP-independent transporter DctM subunit